MMPLPRMTNAHAPPAIPGRSVRPEEMDYQRNRALNETETAQGAAFLQSLPLTIGALLGHRCNLNCIMCGQRTRYRRLLRGRRTELPAHVSTEVLSLLPTAELLQISGGEPLVYPTTEMLIDALRPHPQVQVVMMTNANLIDDRWVQRICAGAFRRLSISVDAATPATYRRIRRGGQLENVLSATAKIAARRTRWDRPSLTWNFVVMKQNRGEIHDFVNLAHNHGVAAVSFSTLRPQRFSYLRENPLRRHRDAVVLLELMRGAARRARSFGMSWTDRVTPAVHRRFPELRPAHMTQDARSRLAEAGPLRCAAFWRKMTVEADSEWACCWARPEFRRIPFRPETQSLRDAWNAPAYRRARRLLAAGRYSEVCSDLCPIYFRWRSRRPSAGSESARGNG